MVINSITGIVATDRNRVVSFRDKKARELINPWLTTSQYGQNVVVFTKQTWREWEHVRSPNFLICLIGDKEEEKQADFSFPTLKEALSNRRVRMKNIFVLGSFVTEILTNKHLTSLYHLTMDDNYNGDIQNQSVLPNILPFLSQFSELNSYQVAKINIDIYDLKPAQMAVFSSEDRYLSLLENLLSGGSLRPTRNAMTWSLFGTNLSFDLREGFPLLTTKKMAWGSIVKELLFFLRGQTNSKLLEAEGVKIWYDNTTSGFHKKSGLSNYKEGDMGPMYGFNWRHFGAEYQGCDADYQGKGLDQLANLIKEIKETPTSRRICMTTWNPLFVKDCVLWPCHSLVLQFYVEDNFLDVKMYQRSADVFLGLPFNIASTSLLLLLVAKTCDLEARMVHIDLGDYHLYQNHKDQAMIQLMRKPMRLPKVTIKEKKEIDEYLKTDIELTNYKSYPSILAEMLA